MVDIAWIDIVEIVFFGMVGYGISLWLYSDSHSCLLVWFYVFNIIGLTAYLVPLPAVHTLLLYGWPVIGVLFIVMHQHMLQKNFMVFTRVNSENIPVEQSIDELLRSFLQAKNNNKQVICIVEGNDCLDDLLVAPIHINALFNEALFNTLLMSSVYDEQKMILVTQGGLLKAINVTWRRIPDLAWHNDKASLAEWKQNALLFSAKTDALILGISLGSFGCFDVVTQGKLLEQLYVNQVRDLMSKKNTQKYPQEFMPTALKKGELYDKA